MEGNSIPGRKVMDVDANLFFGPSSDKGSGARLTLLLVPHFCCIACTVPWCVQRPEYFFGCHFTQLTEYVPHMTLCFLNQRIMNAKSDGSHMNRTLIHGRELAWFFFLIFVASTNRAVLNSC